MNFRGYISVIVLAILAAVGLQQPKFANQELVLQFSETVSSQYTNATIAEVTAQLERLGADNITVYSQNGSLKIAYFSSAKVSHVKAQLLQKYILHDVDYTLPKSELPLEQSSNDSDNTLAYQLDVYELHPKSQTNFNVDGVTILDVKSENDRVSTTTFYPAVAKLQTQHINLWYDVAYKAIYQVRLYTDTNSYNIPEVRAGPLA